MGTNPWDDDGSWWHQQDLELQERDEEERIKRCNAALAELTSIINEELTKVGYERITKN
jgi:hypothetical protein